MGAEMKQVKERGILFSGEMVRAILRRENPKTQTRRVAKLTASGRIKEPGRQRNWHPDDPEVVNGCPYGKPGDQLYVRETWYYDDIDFIEQKGYAQPLDFDPLNLYYRADGECCDQIPECQCAEIGKPKWIPNIHMPRWASRILLEITDVRVERIQDISEEDAIAEGAQRFPDLPGKNPYGQDRRWSMEKPNSVDQCLGSARYAFANYFCKIAGKGPKGIHDPRPWNANPWVWVIKFQKITP